MTRGPAQRCYSLWSSLFPGLYRLTPRISCALTSQKWDLQARGRYCFVLLFIALAVADPVASSLPMNAAGPEVYPVVSVGVLAGGRYAPRLSLRDNLDPPA